MSKQTLTTTIMSRRRTPLCIGVDLGTTNAVVAVSRKGKVDVIANDSGSRTTPCVLGFMGGESFVGEAARDLPPESAVFGEYRKMEDLNQQWNIKFFTVTSTPQNHTVS